MARVEINPYVFRQYDIRGIADRDFTDPITVLLGKAIGTYLRRRGVKTLSLGRDVRPSSNRLRNSLIHGLTNVGVNVIDIGVVPTPVLYFSVYELNVDAGVMITGSHNPPEYNGFKLTLRDETIYGEQIQQIRRIMEEEDFDSGLGNLKEEDIVPRYIEVLKTKVKLTRSPYIIIDPGNGTAGPIAKQLFTELGAKVECIYCEPDGNFPNHLPDPTVPEFVKDLQRRVTTKGADLGISYDGDADRVGIITEKGDMVYGDQLLGILAKDLLTRHPGAKIIFDVKCSQGLEEYIRQLGGIPIIWKTGHSLLKAKMREEHALLAGEMSAHMFIKEDYYGFDDAIFASLKLVEIWSKSGKSFSELVSEIPYYCSTPEIRRPSTDEHKFTIVNKLRDRFREKGYKLLDIDGARIYFPNGWALVRASNTQPILVLRFEAKDEANLQRIKQIVEQELSEIEDEVGIRKE